MDRRTLVRSIEDAVGERRVVWVGLRGDDAEPLSDLDQFHSAFSLFSRYDQRVEVRSRAYEDISGHRVDPETWDIDDHLGDEATRTFRNDLLRALSAESLVVPYRPSQFLSAILFARSTRCKPLGIFGALQSALEHKPWVETELGRRDIPRVPWRYVADEEQLSAATMFHDGPLMVRRSRTSGGEGLTFVSTPDDLVAQWPKIDEAFASIAPYLEGLPVNVGAVVWADGVTVHHASMQLIGIPNLVTRRFGYCGNDFGAARDLPVEVLDQIEETTRTIGAWLGQHGFRGAFGVDFLVHDGQALFLEVNPRFQGSTHASAQLDAEADESCLVLEHVAAWLDLPAPVSRPLRDQARDIPDLSHAVIHWPGPDSTVDPSALVRAVRDHPGTARVELAPDPRIICEVGSAVLRWTVRSRVTTSGYDLLPEFQGMDSRLIEPTDNRR